MNHDQATRYFDDLAHDIHSKPPTAQILALGRTSARHRQRRTLAASVAVVALVLGGGAAVQQVVAGDGEKPKPPPGQIAELPVAPDGMRFAGAGRVVVAVPESWEVNSDGGCRAPWSDNWSSLVLREPCRAGHVSSAVVLERGASLWGDVPPLEGMTRELVNDVQVLQGDFICPPTASCTMPDAHVLAIPSEGVTVTWLGGVVGQADVPQMIATLQLLPEGFTTVPFVEPGTLRRDAETIVEDAGLRPRVNAPDADVPIAGMEPAAGTVVRVPSTVTLLPTPRVLTCPTEMRAVADAPFFDESTPGAATPEAAVEAWLNGALGRSFGPDYVMDEDNRHAWLLRADGTAEARVRVKLTSGGGYFYYGHEACG